MGQQPLPNGTTARVHVEWLMDEVDAVVSESFRRIRTQRRLKPAERAHLWRELAGVVGKVESLRLWLDAGAPEMSRKG